MAKLKYDDLDGSILVTDVELEELKIEDHVAEILDRVKRAEKAIVDIEFADGDDEFEDLMEDEECHRMMAHRLSISLKKPNYDKFGLDKVFGVTYTQMRVQMGLSVHPNTKAGRADTKSDDDVDVDQPDADDTIIEI